VKTKKLLAAVEDGTQTAVEYLTPYVEQALREGGELADQTYTKLRPVLNDARVRGARIAADTFEKVHPSIDDALDRVSPAVEASVRKVQPAVDDALTRIPPTVDFARSKVQDEFLKNLSKTLAQAAAQPLSTEVKAAVATAALAKQFSNAVAPKRSGWRTFGKLLLAGALLGGVIVAIKKLLADPSTGWETHSPRSSYVADPVNPAEEAKQKASAFAAKAKAAAADVVDKAKDVAEDVADKAADLVDDVVESAKDIGEDVADQAKDVADDVADKVDDAKDLAEDVEDKLAKLAEEADAAEGDDASPLAGSPYGEGSYVGDEPPEGFVIKGNDRSMKYHLPGSAAYERTIAEVWFASEEAAEAAGFVRAQR